MAEFLLGVNPTVTDTTAQFPLGTEARDPRTQDFPNNVIRYIRADSTIAAGDALKIKADETDEPNALIPTSAIQQPVVAVAHVAIASGSHGWVTVRGKVNANVAAVTAEDRLGSSASAGRIQTLTQADSNFTSNDYFEILSVAAGVGIIAVDSGNSNALCEVLLT